MELKDIQCYKCKFWGDGDGKGFPYDAGAVNYCQHKLITGMQHPSSAAYSDDAISKVMVDGGTDVAHTVMTRRNFGCVLHEKIG